MQKDPQVLIAHPGTGVNSLADLKGRPILLSDASVTAFWVWLKAKYGFTDAQVRKYTFNSAHHSSPTSGSIQQGYVTSEPYTIEKEAGLEAGKVFLLADEGLPRLRGHGAGANDGLIAKTPTAVKRLQRGDAPRAGRELPARRRRAWATRSSARTIPRCSRTCSTRRARRCAPVRHRRRAGRRA
jgi:NitT/TauT family transport system substrate-binding protein